MEKLQLSFITTNPLYPAGPAEELFIAGASVFEITNFQPPLQRITVIGINLPEPRTFGPYNNYLAVLVSGDEEVEELGGLFLNPTISREVWAGVTFLNFGGTFFPINIQIRPTGDEGQIGPVILEGPLIPIEEDNDGEENKD